MLPDFHAALGNQQAIISTDDRHDKDKGQESKSSITSFNEFLHRSHSIAKNSESSFMTFGEFLQHSHSFTGLPKNWYFCYNPIFLIQQCGLIFYIIIGLQARVPGNRKEWFFHSNLFPCVLATSAIMLMFLWYISSLYQIEPIVRNLHCIDI